MKLKSKLTLIILKCCFFKKIVLPWPLLHQKGELEISADVYVETARNMGYRFKKINRFLFL